MSKKTITRFRLTTNDNPFDPFDEFENWLNFDSTVLGYNSSAYLARMFPDSDLYTEEEREAVLEDTIDKIIELDPLNIYKKVSKEFVLDEQTEV